MNATLNPPEMKTAEPPKNRLKGYFANQRPQLPKTEQERHAVLSDCVMEAMLAMREQLYCGIPELVTQAATVILDVEKTRLRHDRNVSGCRPPLQRIDPSQFDDLPSVEPQGAERPEKRSHSMASGDEEMLLAQLEKNLGMMFGTDNDDDDIEEEVPPPAPAKPSPVYAKTEEEALDWHADELKKGLLRAELIKPEKVNAPGIETDMRMIVEFHLNQWKMKAIEIPKGGFWRTVASKMKK